MSSPDRPCINCHRLEDAHEPGGCEFRPGPVVHGRMISPEAYDQIYNHKMTFVILPTDPDILEGDQLEIRTPDHLGHPLPGALAATAAVICQGQEWGLPEGVMVIQLGPPNKDGAAWKHRPFDKKNPGGKLN